MPIDPSACACGPSTLNGSPCRPPTMASMSRAAGPRAVRRLRFDTRSHCRASHLIDEVDYSARRNRQPRRPAADLVAQLVQRLAQQEERQQPGGGLVIVRVGAGRRGDLAVGADAVGDLPVAPAQRQRRQMLAGNDAFGADAVERRPRRIVERAQRAGQIVQRRGLGRAAPAASAPARPRSRRSSDRPGR